jgi:hypothetical protein
LPAGGGKAIDLRDASIADLANATRSAALQKTGQWTVESRVTAMDLGTTDPAMAPMIRQQAMQPHSTSICVDGSRPSLMLPDQMQATRTMACRVPRFTARDGNLDGQIACAGPGGSTTFEQHGHYTANDFALQMLIKQTGEGQPAISMETEVQARRTGECGK